MLVHHEQADCGRSGGNFTPSVYVGLLPPQKKARLTYPTAIYDGLSDPFQVNMLKSPDGGTYDDPKDAVRERVHGDIYTSENDAKGIEDNRCKIAVVAG